MQTTNLAKFQEFFNPPHSEKTYLLWRVLTFEAGYEYMICGSRFIGSESVSIQKKKFLMNKNLKNIV
jgi:hypothetical protein